MDNPDLFWAKTVLYLILGGIVFLILSTVAYQLWCWWDDWWTGIWGPSTKKTYDYGKNTYNTGYIAKPVKPLVQKVFGPKKTYLLDSDRRNPPRAEFFGRLDAETYSGAGPYEEKYLNTWEKQAWDERKRIADELRADSEAKTTEMVEIIDDMGQKCEILLEIAPKEVKNG